MGPGGQARGEGVDDGGARWTDRRQSAGGPCRASRRQPRLRQPHDSVGHLGGGHSAAEENRNGHLDSKNSSRGKFGPLSLLNLTIAVSLNVEVGQGQHSAPLSADLVTGTVAPSVYLGGSPPRTRASGDRGAGWGWGAPRDRFSWLCWGHPEGGAGTSLPLNFQRLPGLDTV